MKAFARIGAAPRRISITLLIALLSLSAVSRVVSASLAVIPDEIASTDETGLLCPPSGEVADLLERITERDARLDSRAQEIALREQDVELARQEVLAAIDEMRAAEETLAARMQRSDAASDEDVARLVTVYEGMKPKDAAILFEAMAPDFAAGFLARMRPDVAAGIFSSLTPDTAYALSVLMAGRNANAATE